MTEDGYIQPLYAWAGQAGDISPKWKAVIAQATQNPKVPFIVKINPNSGPDTIVHSDFTKGIAALKAVKIIVLGYVSTNYGSESIADVQNEIDRWYEFYPDIDGIFFDEMSSTVGPNNVLLNYYTTIGKYAKSKGAKM